MSADDLIGELDSYLSEHCSADFSVSGTRSSGSSGSNGSNGSSANLINRAIEPSSSPGPGTNPRSNLLNMNPGSCPPMLGSGTSQVESINRQMTAESPSSHYAEKRKIDTDAVDTSYGNNPSKIPKIEVKGERPETPLNSANLGRRAMSSDNLNSVGNMMGMSGGSVKVELKPEMNQVLGMTPGPGGINTIPANPEESFLLENTSLPTEPGQQQTPVDQNVDKQKATTAARIRGALEASGLAGNLTPEDLQTLKRLNEIAKSTGLSQEQKSAEASQLLKNNHNVSRLLLKLRTEKSISSPRRPDQPGMPGQNMGPGGGGMPMGPVPSNSPFAPGVPVGGGRSTPGNQIPFNYNTTNYGNNNNSNYYPNGPGHRGPIPPGQWNGSPGSPGPGGFYRGNMMLGPTGRDMLPNMTEIQHMGPGPMQRMHPEMGHGGGGYPGNFNPMGLRGPTSNMYHSMGPMDRMHPGPMNMNPARMGMGEPTRTMYMNRQTGMLVPDYPNPNMIGPRPPGYSSGNVPPPYISPSGFHPGHPNQIMPQRRVPGPLMNHQDGPGSPGGQYEIGSNPMHRGNSSMYPINPDYDNNFSGGGNNFRENLLTSKFQGNDQPQRQQPLPPQTESQLRARLSQPSTASSSNSELANRLLHGKPSGAESPYDYNNMNIIKNGNTQNTIQKSGTESLFDEIDNSQFNYLNPLETNDDQRSQNYFDNTQSMDNLQTEFWKGSSKTNDLRSTLLRKLSTAIEQSQKISPNEASKMANDIESKAFAIADTEEAYMHSIAQHLAKIFSQSKASEETPDSTTWQDQPSGAPNSSPDSSQSSAPTSSTTTITKSENSHFQTDTTLHCFQENLDTTELSELMTDPTSSPLAPSDSNFQTPSVTTPQAGPAHTNVIIQRGNRRLSGKTNNTHQPHSVDSGIGSPRSIPLYSPNPPITPKTSGSSPSVSLSENSPEK